MHRECGERLGAALLPGLEWGGKGSLPHTIAVVLLLSQAHGLIGACQQVQPALVLFSRGHLSVPTSLTLDSQAGPAKRKTCATNNSSPFVAPSG